MTRTLIHNGYLLTMDKHGEQIPGGSLLIENGKIAYVGPATELGPVGDADVIDADGCAVLPGLINCHTHLCMIYGRTIGVERRLLDWLQIEMPIMARLDTEATLLGTALGCVENLKNGNTTVVENTFIPRSDDFTPEDAIFRSMKAVGIRGIVARAYHARNIAPAFIETREEQDAKVEALHGAWHGSENGRLGLSIGPLLPWVVEVEDLRATRRLADRLGIKIHMHVAESPEFNQKIAEAYGRDIRNVELLHEGECLGPDVQAVAVADLSDREIELLAESGTPVVFDPQTRLFWGTGFPGIKRFTDAGLTAGLGTNGPAANCGQDLFETMKYACATAKTAANDPTALGRHRVLEMATIEGARTLGIDDRTGSLEVGKDGDAITVNLSQPHLTPAIDVPAALVYAAKGSDVRDALVAGRVVMRDRTMLTVDEAELLKDCNTMAAKLVTTPPAGGGERHVA